MQWVLIIWHGNAGGTHWAGWVDALRKFLSRRNGLLRGKEPSIAAEPAGSFYSCPAPDWTKVIATLAHDCCTRSGCSPLTHPWWC